MCASSKAHAPIANLNKRTTADDNITFTPQEHGRLAQQGTGQVGTLRAW
jgi:hypothetical protein